ncbi:hypothetical protein [Plantactinospora sonchi]|uniref:Uncharacterized protein n=1 Tax=Plantactinospora sonchi TaxID=1544735 RepID=A0ABU7RKZ8_9ACTN
MADPHRDPSGNTEAFRAFAHSGEAPAAAPPSRLPLIIGVVVVVALLIVLIGWLALG